MKRSSILVCCVLLAIGFGCGPAICEGPEHQYGEDEESGKQLGLSERYDATRNGARLTLAYDERVSAFVGTVENTTKKTLKNVRVEVHLSNGKELGPTKPRDLKPGAKMPVQLPTKSKDFDGWTAHPEVGNDEHGHEHGEGDSHSHGG